jgi:ketosteroid isomerase-like protein
MDLTTRSGAEAVSLEGMRVTSVLEKRQGKWLIVHFHYSMPVAGQAIKY